MSVAIIIPSLDSPLIDRVIAALRGQTAWDLVDEVLVVGKDRPGLVRPFDRVRLFDTGAAVGPGAARNIGIRETRAPLCVFLDSDCLPSSGWLAAHVRAHEEGHAVVGGGIVPDGETGWALTYNLTMFHEVLAVCAAGPRDALPTCNLSIERAVLEQVGALREDLPRCEDIEWTHRMRDAGFTPYFWPSASVQHRHARVTFASVWRDCELSGFFSARLRAARTTSRPLRWLLQSPVALLALSPLMATVSTASVVREAGFPLREHWRAVPGVWSTKIAWCVGAARGARAR